MTDFNSLAEAMAAGADRAVQLAADGRVNLDFSLDSLRIVEEQLASLHNALPKGLFARLTRKGPSSAEIDLMAMTFGAYVGEVLRRQFGGQWSYENSLQPGVQLATLHLPDGGEIWPQVKVNKRLRMGPEENVWVYAQTLVSQLQAAGHGVTAPQGMALGTRAPADAPDRPSTVDAAAAAARLAQWLALVCDGDADAVAAALQLADPAMDLDEQCRTLFSCLADEGQVLYADLKDDDTLAAQMQELVERRIPAASLDAEALGGADPGGASRCEALLAGLREWLAATAPEWCLLQLDQGQDDWMGLLVRRAQVSELQRLSRELGLSGRLV